MGGPNISSTEIELSTYPKYFIFSSIKVIAIIEFVQVISMASAPPYKNLQKKVRV